MLVGTVLGDGFLQKTGQKNARLRLEHGEKQKEYLLWKAAQFPRFFQGRPTRLTRTHPHSGQTCAYWRQQSHSSPIFGKWRNVFYPDGTKHIPADLPEMLTDELSLAVWYMDDGYYYARDKTSFLYLGRVRADEAETARRTIEQNFGVSSRVKDKRKKGFVLYFPPAETVRLHNRMRKHMLPLFNYKLTPP